MILLTRCIGYILQTGASKNSLPRRTSDIWKLSQRIWSLVYFIMTFSCSDKCLIIICSSVKVVSNYMCKSNKWKYYELLVDHSCWHLWYSSIIYYIYEQWWKAIVLLLILYSPKGYTRQLLAFTKIKANLVSVFFEMA